MVGASSPQNRYKYCSTHLLIVLGVFERTSLLVIKLMLAKQRLPLRLSWSFLIADPLVLPLANICVGSDVFLCEFYC